MVQENKEQFRLYYQAGKNALERGKYRQSVENLEKALEIVGFVSRLGGETQMLLITAYQAMGNQEKAIALCQELTTHPNGITSKKAVEVLYIIQAPELKRPESWMSKIPDMSQNDTTTPQYVTARKSPKRHPPKIEPEIDLSQVETEDNKFLWFALILTAITCGGLIWLS
ncbi:MAG: tetratricopeptide repeat protein [Xenococcaceae cyanobacterium MO_167.B27]|nr:tetratricopeptide repeat protein [Xenococcaceae cyanobacterium MO_167.B27]